MTEGRGGRNQSRLLAEKVQKLVDENDSKQRFPFSQLLHLPVVRNYIIETSLLHRMVDSGHTNLMLAFVPGGVWSQLGNQIFTAEELAERMGNHQAREKIRQCSIWENSIGMPLKAARDGSFETVRDMLLKEQFASLNQPDIYGYDLLSWACISGHEDLVNFIIGHETDPRNMNANAHLPLLNWLPALTWTPKNIVDLVLPKFEIICDDVMTAVNQRGSGPDHVPLINQAYNVGNIYVAGKLLQLRAACPPQPRISIEEHLPTGN